MNEKAVLLIGGIAVAGIVVVMLAKSKTQTQAQQQQYALQAQSYALQQQQAYLSSKPAMVSSVLSSAGNFINSGALGSLFSDFGIGGGGSNDPGLGSSSQDIIDTSSNDPGLQVNLGF